MAWPSFPAKCVRFCPLRRLFSFSLRQAVSRFYSACCESIFGPTGAYIALSLCVNVRYCAHHSAENNPNLCPYKCRYHISPSQCTHIGKRKEIIRELEEFPRGRKARLLPEETRKEETKSGGQKTLRRVMSRPAVQKEGHTAP